MRKKRKLDHLNLVRNLHDGPAAPGFADVSFVHNCLPEIDPSEVTTTARLCGRSVEMPLMINAITGGIAEAERINRAFAAVARRLGIPMAVGSQTVALQDEPARSSFAVVREVNPHGFLVANVGAGAPLEDALEAVKMIDADALQLHLNAAQEVAMPAAEGDLTFKGFLAKIEKLAALSPVPIIVKEVGYGIAREQAEQLISRHIAAIDIGGKGGTNFIRIEGFRGSSGAVRPFLSWGISTVASLVEVAEVAAASRVDIIAAGGIRNGLDVAKALSLGASLAALAAPLLRCYYKGGEAAVENYLLQLHKQLRQVMLLLGARSLSELRRRPLVILGETGKWLERRGFDLDRFARRGWLP